jgi:hypothetical protein
MFLDEVKVNFDPEDSSFEEESRVFGLKEGEVGPFQLDEFDRRVLDQIQNHHLERMAGKGDVMAHLRDVHFLADIHDQIVQRMAAGSV